MPTLFVKCRSCSREIPSPIAESKTGDSGVMISSLRIRCTGCGHEDEYSTADFHLPQVVDGPLSGGRVTAQEDLGAVHEAQLQEAQEKLAGYGVVPAEGRSTHEG